MTKAEKINQLLAGIICEHNSQCSINEQLQNSTSTYPKAFEKHVDSIYDRLESIYKDICDFSNDRDINDECTVRFNNAILQNLKEEEE